MTRWKTHCNWREYIFSFRFDSVSAKIQEKNLKKKVSEIIIFLFNKIFSFNYKISVKHKRSDILLKASKNQFFFIQLNSEFSYR